jgi:hypothetical protein
MHVFLHWLRSSIERISRIRYQTPAGVSEVHGENRFSSSMMYGPKKHNCYTVIDQLIKLMFIARTRYPLGVGIFLSAVTSRIHQELTNSPT